MRGRDFLHPKHLAKTAGQVFDTVGDWTAAAATFERRSDLLAFGRQAMATTFEVLLSFDAATHRGGRGSSISSINWNRS